MGDPSKTFLERAGKFWEIAVVDTTTTVRVGKIGMFPP
jgi:hypothetical protein